MEPNSKINLPKLKKIRVTYAKLLDYFTDLKSLRGIEVKIEWDEIIEINKIFDPSKILELEIGSIKKIETLSLFKNLRSLKLNFTLTKYP